MKNQGRIQDADKMGAKLTEKKIFYTSSLLHSTPLETQCLFPLEPNVFTPSNSYKSNFEQKIIFSIQWGQF